jgi:hypothetical protein
MKLYIVKSTLILSLISFSLAGCLKDDAYEDQKIQSTRSEGSPKIIELKLTANSAKNFLLKTFANSNNDTTFEAIPVNLATPDVAPEDINVTIVADTNVVKKYNADNSTAYAGATSSMYTIVNPTVTIPKGSHTGYLKLKLKSSDYLGNDWGIGFKIASVDKPGYTISGNLSTSVMAVVVKNQYDGEYHSLGVFHHPTAGDRAIDEDKDLVTAGPTSVRAPLGDLGGSDYYMILTVNPDNSVTIAPSGATPNVDQTWGPNYYDPVGKAFHLFYSYNVAAPRKIEETITLK